MSGAVMDVGTRAAGDPRALVDQGAMSPAQIGGVIITGLLSALDGFDVLSITFAAPAITQSWGIGKAALGLVLSSGLIGMALGSLLIAPLADILGRRRLVLFCLTLMGAGMLLSATARSIEALAAWRILTGLGIGAAVPIIAPLAAEYSNLRRRTLSMSIMSIGYPLGGMIGGVVSAYLLRHFDWHAVFILGGLLSLLLLPVIYFWMPEPLAFLLEKPHPRRLERVNAFLSRCQLPPVDSLPDQVPQATIPYGAIFGPLQWRATLLITMVNLLFMITVYFVLSWTPQLIADAGFAPSTASLVAALSNLAGIVTCLLLGAVASRLPLRPLAAVMLIGLGAAAALFGLAPPVLALLAGAAALCGLFLYSGIAVVYTLIVTTFDARMRVSGTGWVMGVGRISGAVGPAVAGFLLGAGANRAEVCAVMGAVAVAAGLAVLAAPKVRAG